MLRNDSFVGTCRANQYSKRTKMKSREAMGFYAPDNIFFYRHLGGYLCAAEGNQVVSVEKNDMQQAS